MAAAAASGGGVSAAGGSDRAFVLDYYLMKERARLSKKHVSADDKKYQALEALITEFSKDSTQLDAAHAAQVLDYAMMKRGTDAPTSLGTLMDIKVIHSIYDRDNLAAMLEKIASDLTGAHVTMLKDSHASVIRHEYLREVPAKFLIASSTVYKGLGGWCKQESADLKFVIREFLIKECERLEKESEKYKGFQAVLELTSKEDSLKTDAQLYTIADEILRVAAIQRTAGKKGITQSQMNLKDSNLFIQFKVLEGVKARVHSVPANLAGVLAAICRDFAPKPSLTTFAPGSSGAAAAAVAAAAAGGPVAAPR